MERVFTLKKRFLFPALLFVFIAIIFTIGCTNHLLKPHQSDLSILVKLDKSSGRNITTGDYQITAWIENRDGTESHHQEINSTAGADASIIFEELVIGSEINIHLEVVETGTTGKKLVGTSDWITVNEGRNVVVIVLREDSDTGEIDDPVAGDDPEDEGDPVLSRIEAQYASGEYQLVNTNIDPSKITITQYFNDGSTNVVQASDLSTDYNIAFAANASINSSIGNVPATVTHGTFSATFTIPVKYTLDASHLTLNGTTSVEQNGTLELTANYPDTTYQIYDGNGGSTTYQVKDNLNISWTGGATGSSWTATANTTTTGQQTATIKLTPKDEWCVTTNGITASHEYEVTSSAAPSDGISTQEQLVQAIANASAKDTITISNTITITETLVIDKDIEIEGGENVSLLRATGTVTGPMIEVKAGVSLDLNSITLDGQWDSTNANGDDGENNPLIYVHMGVLNIYNVKLQNNYMTYGTAYTDKNEKSVYLKAAAAIYALDSQLIIIDSTFTNFYANDGQGGVVYIDGTAKEASYIYIEGTSIDSCGGNSNRALQMGVDSTAFNNNYIAYDINGITTGLTRQITSITPDSP